VVISKLFGQVKRYSDKSLGFHYKTPNCKTPSNLTVDGCSVRLMLLKAFTTLTLPAVFPS